jgi:O-antigen ligase
LIYQTTIRFINAPFSYVGLMAALIASVFILLNNLNQLSHSHFYFSTFCFFVMLGVGFVASRRVALATFVFLVPLAPTLSNQITAYTGTALLSQAMMGFDLVASYFLAIFTKHVLYSMAAPHAKGMGHLKAGWPVNWVILIISCSTLLAVIRNAWHSAAPLTFAGISLGLIEVRGIGWLEDLRPLTDWMAYALAGAIIILVGSTLRTLPERNHYIFRPVMAGLFFSGILAVVQSRTGLGIGIVSIRDALGYSAMGFQPDLHAFAAYILLGALGLLGYFSVCKSNVEKAWIGVVVILSWIALLLSYSRATQLFALMALAILVLIRLFGQNNRQFRMRSLIGLGLLMGITTALILFFQENLLAIIPQRNLAIFKAIADMDWNNFAQINAALSERPVIWLNALRMWGSFPLFGVGQGDFYQLSPLFNFENLAFLRGGENAHNYFLQTLAETGLVGVIAFALAIIAPFFLVKDRQVLMPAAIALFSLFLGNIYAHSFLVRENLFLAAIFLGLMYSYVPQEKLALSPYQLLIAWKPQLSWKWIIPIACLAFVGLGAREIYTSFYRFPFEYGSACFVNKPLSEDRWSSGLYEIPLPIGSHGVQLPIRVARPNIQKIPLSATLEIVDSGKHILASQTLVWSKEGPEALKISLPNGGVVTGAGVKASLKLSSCWTPRNLGISIDGRRLGVLIDPPIID